MALPKWAPGTFYPPGSLVQPLSAIPPVITSLDNPGFDDGTLGGWTFENVGGSVSPSITTLNSQTSPYNLAFDGADGSGYGGGVELIGINDENPPANPGVVITASMYVRLSFTGLSAGRVLILWYDSLGDEISRVGGNLVQKPGNSSERWVLSTITAQAPAGTTSVKVGFWCAANGSGDVRMDSLSWNYSSAAAPEGLIFKAVQPLAGFSDSVEPVWPAVNGQTVVDNEVIWEAVLQTRIFWEAQPILVSGPTEPTWPEVDGENVSDNTIVWEAVSRRVEDEKCPNSKIVIIAASKVFAADEDIVAYSATVNPLDWSSANDAGYLPSNLQQYGANPVSGLGLYRGNLAVMNSQGSQVWQVDEDPAQMALLDAFPVGTSWHDSISPAFNDLFFLTSLGVRTFGIAGGSTNLQAGDAGMPIDPLVQAKLLVGPPSMSLYFPAQGQYWLFFGAEAFIYTMNRLGSVGAWTRYVFPFTPTDYTIKGESLYLRAGDVVHKVNPELESDEVAGEPEPFDWFVQWPWLDMGQLGTTKGLVGFDIVGYGNARVQFGYDQSNGGLYTPDWEIMADSVPGQILPMPLSAPSVSVKITYTGSDETRTGLDAINVYLNDYRMTS